ncbi:hypothetical protein E4U42_008033 [Claviceps africana]|uniref:RRM domain-containing protein n=1 Tax=Claviceps africana TaxID=83212 RepID=A0A8K0JB41_9HYPO|nr:hypothetical protein E4U42_008033 [Claviceps africana]
MVAAAAGDTDAPHDDAVVDPLLAQPAEPTDNDDVVDDDSLNDPYDEELEQATSHQIQPQQDPLDSNDDYAKTFDSPIEPEDEDAHDDAHQDEHQNKHHASSSTSQGPQQESTPSAQVTVNQSSDAHPAIAHDPSATSSAMPSAADHHGSAQPESPADASALAHQLVEDQQREIQSAQIKSTNEADSRVLEQQNSSSLDIQKLVADLTAQPDDTKSDHDPDPAALSIESEPPMGSASLSSSTALPSPSSLPPRPPQPYSASPSYAAQHHPLGANPNATVAAHPTSGQSSSSYHTGSAPGTSTDSAASLPPPPHNGMNVLSYSAQPATGYSSDQGHDVDYQRQWDQFMADERQYMSEAKWDRFPDGSRIFIGNLSSDKVSKRDVFDLFHRYGRLAQISLKSAYGFVQYHTVDEGRRAMENLQGIEIKGRRIHLEISRLQDKSKKERHRSPERGRGRDGGRRNDKHSHQTRDDYRPGRNHSPRRNDYHHSRDDSFGGRDRGYGDSGRGARGRSRSPGYARNDRDAYRRRSPSPHGRPRHEPDLDLPRRYGSDVPDVQIILQPDINRDFVSWVEGAFKSKALKTEVMYLHPRFPKEQVIQRQAAEGVHAVVDLDIRAQNLGRIPAQVFDRSNGNNNVRFDQYVDLDPSTAAEVVSRAKVSAAAAAAAAAANYGQAYGAAGAYQNSYGVHSQQAAYNGATGPGAYPPHPHLHHAQQQQQPQQQPAASTADLANLVGQVDNATLQRLLSTMQSQGAAPPAGGVYGHGNAATSPPQIDIQAILGSLGGATQQHVPPPQVPYGASYAAQPPNGGGIPKSAGANGDAASQVQNIMAQLARYRQ